MESFPIHVDEEKTDHLEGMENAKMGINNKVLRFSHQG